MRINVREIDSREWHVTACTPDFDGDRGIAYIRQDGQPRPYLIESTPPSGGRPVRQRRKSFGEAKQLARQLAMSHFAVLARGQS